MSASVELKNASVTFGNFYAAKNVDVKINGGEFFSFLGPSGCGKTTLLRAISGFQELSNGEVLIDGANMSGIGPNKRPTSLIFQNLALFPLMSVSDNIAFSLEVRGVTKQKRKARADELLELMALDGQAEKMVHQLSGGQKQRVAIARAMVTQPKVLLADELTGALDSATSIEVMSLIQEINNNGKTILVVTHEEDIAMMCKRIVRLKDGVIVEDKNIKQIIAK